MISKKILNQLAQISLVLFLLGAFPSKLLAQGDLSSDEACSLVKALFTKEPQVLPKLATIPTFPPTILPVIILSFCHCTNISITDFITLIQTFNEHPTTPPSHLLSKEVLLQIISKLYAQLVKETEALQHKRETTEAPTLKNREELLDNSQEYFHLLLTHIHFVISQAIFTARASLEKETTPVHFSAPKEYCELGALVREAANQDLSQDYASLPSSEQIYGEYNSDASELNLEQENLALRTHGPQPFTEKNTNWQLFLVPGAGIQLNHIVSALFVEYLLKFGGSTQASNTQQRRE